MNKIIRKYYTVDKLPEDLRVLLDPSKPVTLVIEQEDDPPRKEAGRAFMRFYGAAKERKTSVTKAVERIRNLRDEWE
ncbi:hypothetical protein [Microvirga arsenatis]|uniref:Uncharacterized protein n=1 Tax=Microvirga arsenatis TaxID=2692265 RepID=A0ABW9YXG9_9HYPH|nr:hypothetical protein [Microvirga arsenatis]NBJ11770.1 hypothetical protein [Microvirga arsenatis]NBJ25051.1 hypothetical protein [Microvirga arsenatis]